MSVCLFVCALVCLTASVFCVSVFLPYLAFCVLVCLFLVVLFAFCCYSFVGVQHHTTREHVQFSEHGLRTVKDMVYERIEADKKKKEKCRMGRLYI